jgi:hypothetical protein
LVNLLWAVAIHMPKDFLIAFMALRLRALETSAVDHRSCHSGPIWFVKEDFQLLSLPTRKYSSLGNAYSASIRCAGLAVGDLLGSSDGLHGSQCGHEHPGACLLPHDEEPMRADGDAGVAWLLSEDSAERPR